MAREQLPSQQNDIMSGQNTPIHPAFTSRDASSGVLPAGVYTIAFLAMLPLAALIYQASGDSQDVWPHLVSFVLPSSMATTLLLLVGVAAGTFVLGAGTAWLTSRYRFPFSGFFQWALVLPLATPTYVAAYTWVEFADYTGPVQQLVRDLGGYENSTQYWFPELRSTGGAIFLLSLVLFPYVYLPARLSFQSLGTSMLDVARVLGAGPVRLFLKVALPAARPAIAVGVILALMETLNDIGAVEYLGVRTLTFSVFDTWLNRSSLAGAAQLSLALLVFVGILVVLERRLRARQSFHEGRQSRQALEQIQLSGARAWLAAAACGLPIALGFAVPIAEMAGSIFRRPEQITHLALLNASANSLIVAVSTALLCVMAGFVLAQARRHAAGSAIRAATLASGFGYAIPGTILAIGVLTAMTGIDNQVSRIAYVLTGYKTGLVLSGSLAIVVFACSVRFLAVALGNIEAGYARISPNLASAARTLGRSNEQVVFQIELPLLFKTLSVAALLVIVETMKELSATMLLRPFNFDTLATFVYSHASRAMFEQAAFAALLIVLIGLVPVFLLTQVFITGQSVMPRQKKMRTDLVRSLNSKGTSGS